jgi:hypothetical protein
VCGSVDLGVKHRCVGLLHNQKPSLEVYADDWTTTAHCIVLNCHVMYRYSGTAVLIYCGTAAALYCTVALLQGCQQYG